MPIAEVNDPLRTVTLRSRNSLNHEMETTLPPRLEGLTTVQQRPILREARDQIYDSMAGIVIAWAFGRPPQVA
jgi:hypothetical protein